MLHDIVLQAPHKISLLCRPFFYAFFFLTPMIDQVGMVFPLLSSF